MSAETAMGEDGLNRDAHGIPHVYRKSEACAFCLLCGRDIPVVETVCHEIGVCDVCSNVISSAQWAKALVSDKEAERFSLMIIGILRPDGYGFSRQRLFTIKRFLRLIGINEVKDAAELSVSKTFGCEDDRFTYFCGVCWSKIRASGKQHEQS